MAQPAGINLTPLFSAPAPNEEERSRRIEKAVQDLRDDFDTILPSVVRLVAVEKDMKDLIGQLKSLTQEEISPASMPVPMETLALAPEPTPLANEPEAPLLLLEPIALKPSSATPSTPARQTGSAVAQGIRFGDHPGKTRVVIDLSAKIDFTTALQNGNRQLAINLPDTDWNAKTTWKADGGDLVAGYHYEASRLTIDFISPSKILAQSLIPGENGKGFRIVIDVAGQSAL